MSETKNDGGPAFPGFQYSEGHGCLRPVDGGFEVHDPGMLIRDYFAAAAMQGLCADYGRTTCMEKGAHENLAMIAYRIADAMLAERAGAGRRAV